VLGGHDARFPQFRLDRFGSDASWAGMWCFLLSTPAWVQLCGPDVHVRVGDVALACGMPVERDHFRVVDRLNRMHVAPGGDLVRAAIPVMRNVDDLVLDGEIESDDVFRISLGRQGPEAP
jgi:hypothetical protein